MSKDRRAEGVEASLMMDVSVVSKLSGWLFERCSRAHSDMTRPAPVKIRAKRPQESESTDHSKALWLSVSCTTISPINSLRSLLALSLQSHQHGSYKANRP